MVKVVTKTFGSFGDVADARRSIAPLRSSVIDPQSSVDNLHLLEG